MRIALLLVALLVIGCTSPKTINHMGDPSPEQLFDQSAKALAGEP